MTLGQEVKRCLEITSELLAAMPKAWAKKEEIKRFAGRCAYRIVKGTMTMEQGHRNMTKYLHEYRIATLAGAIFNLPVICRNRGICGTDINVLTSNLTCRQLAGNESKFADSPKNDDECDLKSHRNKCSQHVVR